MTEPYDAARTERWSHVAWLAYQAEVDRLISLSMRLEDACVAYGSALGRGGLGQSTDSSYTAVRATRDALYLALQGFPERILTGALDTLEQPRSGESNTSSSAPGHTTPSPAPASPPDHLA